ncbi:hypothetical protein KCV04_g20298, partial [Aureobasidium melanogenum]
DDTIEMLKALDPPAKSLDEFVTQVLPGDILSSRDLKIEGPAVQNSKGQPGQETSSEGFSESQLIDRLKDIASGNKLVRSYIGCGYAGTRVPEVIKRNVLENPAWYTSYTPYQPEISQGRLESLLNFQTMVSDLTGLPISNASVLDEPTAAAEAMTLSINSLPAARQKRPNKVYLVSHLCHPQTIAVLASRAEGFGIKIEVDDILKDGSKRVEEIGEDLVGVLGQYPDTLGGVQDFKNLSEKVHKLKATFSVATDLLALTVLTPPGEFGADVAFGNAQRFGVPFGFGGPHAAFFACSEQHKRKIPGRLIGLSKDRLGNHAARLALQTREQHIRREKATSNICTAQALLANMSAMYAVYHGPEGLKAIAHRVINSTRVVAEAASKCGYTIETTGPLFDTVVLSGGPLSGKAGDFAKLAEQEYKTNLRVIDENRIGITLDETVEKEDLQAIIDLLSGAAKSSSELTVDSLVKDLGLSADEAVSHVPAELRRKSPFLTHPVFNT